jgi:hypothetical protein
MRKVLRSLRLGPRLLRLRRAYEHGLRIEIETYRAKHRYLHDRRFLDPLSSGAGPLDCFMLLDEARIREGIWALYSFRVHAGPCRLVVLNDGTLTRRSIERLESLFPGIHVPDVDTNDAEVLAHLSRLGLLRCREWRERFVFFRKLIDPFLMARSGRIVLLDSDCLHFRRPEDVLAWTKGPARVRFIADAHPASLCAPPEELARICGATLPEFFCAGYLCVPNGAVDFDRIERYLSEECFERQLATGRFEHVAEQSLYAMEAARMRADVLPATYATCPDVPGRDAVMGHFCGGSYARTWFYTKGLPLVRRQLESHAASRATA